MSARRYQFTIASELGDQSLTAFGGMAATRLEGTTILVGQVRDQAELQGVLTRFADLGLTLLNAAIVEDGFSPWEPGPPA